jgi:serine O-acetyltransferase
MRQYQTYHETLVHQLDFFGHLNQHELKILSKYAPLALEQTQATLNKFSTISKTFNYYQTHHCIIYLYRLAKLLDTHGQHQNLSEKIYLLNRMLNSLDLFYKINMPEHFLIGHGLGTVFSNSTYGNYLVVFQNVTIAVQDNLYPSIGEKVVIYPNTIVAGNTVIGSNSVIGAGTKLINKVIPANSIVYERDGVLTIKQNNRDEISNYFNV